MLLINLITVFMETIVLYTIMCNSTYFIISNIIETVVDNELTLEVEIK